MDSPIRPDPDRLLAQLKAQEDAAKAEASRGRLRVFFGANAGVGKTYAMLMAAREKACEGVDVVIGYAEPHNRPETEALTLGLEILPSKMVEYRGTKLREFDLDAALARAPELVLVDELAHTNAPGMRHAKRWQDVRELLDAGIDVYTTVNVQHLESQAEAVTAATGITVQETLPDAIFDAADEVELIDLPPDEFLDRLRDGKVYEPRQAQLAEAGFFKKSNLSALRELSLRKTADRVGDQAQAARRLEDPRSAGPARERILACVTPGPGAPRVVRAAKRMATALHAPWSAVFVETPEWKDADGEEKEALRRNLALAERQGARILSLPGLFAADEILALARSESATRIVIGQAPVAGGFSPVRWWRVLRPSMADKLAAAGVEIHAVPVAPQASWRPPKADAAGWIPSLAETLAALSAVGICTGLCAGIYRLWPAFAPTNFIMLYLVGVAGVAAKSGRVAATTAAVLSVLAFDFFFVPPRFTFVVADGQYAVTFAVMLGVALLIATQTARIRSQVLASRERERRTDALLRMTADMAAQNSLKSALDAAAGHLAAAFRLPVDLLLEEGDAVNVRASSETRPPLGAGELAVARWVRQNGRPAGRGTDTLPGAAALFVPMAAAGRVVGVAGFHGEGAEDLLDPDLRPHLEAMVGQAAVACERALLSTKAREEAASAEAQRLRGTLLASVSHDLRTPLSVILGSSEELLRGAAPDAAAALGTIHAEAQRMDRLVGDLLDITRIESGALALRKEAQSVEEIVGAVLARPLPELRSREIRTDLPSDLPMVQVDGVLVGQALLHLLENAGKYTPADAPIEIVARAEDGLPGGCVAVSVLDRGAGLKEGEAERIFDKFFRGVSATGKPGTGLGLAICRAIVEAHGGSVSAANRQGGGAAFTLRLPTAGEGSRG